MSGGPLDTISNCLCGARPLQRQCRVPRPASCFRLAVRKKPCSRMASRSGPGASRHRRDVVKADEAVGGRVRSGPRNCLAPMVLRLMLLRLKRPKAVSSSWVSRCSGGAGHGGQGAGAQGPPLRAPRWLARGPARPESPSLLPVLAPLPDPPPSSRAAAVPLRPADEPSRSSAGAGPVPTLHLPDKDRAAVSLLPT